MEAQRQKELLSSSERRFVQHSRHLSEVKKRRRRQPSVVKISNAQLPPWLNLLAIDVKKEENKSDYFAAEVL